MRNILKTLIVTMLFTPTFASALTITRPLTVGSRGADVTSLQEFLNARGYLRVSATGYFGPLTKAAVMELQKANGLEPVGNVGPKTRALIADLTAVTLPSPIPVPSPTIPNPPPEPLPTPPPLSPVDPSAMSTTTLDITVVTPSVLSRDTFATDLVVSTNRNAYCRYGTLADMQFSRMTSFSYTGTTLHTKTLSNLGNGTLYVYYVKCEDIHIATVSEKDTVVQFTVSST
jgi:hypothetical protein